MSGRHHAREVALQFLYHSDPKLAAPAPEPAPMAAEILRHFDHFGIREDLREFAARVISGTWTHVKEIDSKIEKQTAHWRLDRMAQVDRSILRLAVYELFWCEDIPPAVVIDEAIELAKAFGNAESAGFINGILDALRKTQKGEPEQT